MFSYLIIINILLALWNVQCQDVVHNVKLDNKEVKCLVCDASLKELTEMIKIIDKDQTMKIGGHRLDPDGNYNVPKSVQAIKSEIFLSELMESMCNKMDDYVRGLWKSNGTLTILKMVTSTGQMNPHMGDVEFVQDDDLNKSLKYYCETILEEYEEQIIKYYQNDEDNVETKFCIRDSKMCPEPDVKTTNLPEKEL